MNSNILKAVLLAHFRYKRNMFVCTEVGLTNGIADVVAVSKKGDMSIEIEVKISKTDLGNEWRNKKRKHETLKREPRYKACRPNYFYFCIPESLYSEKLEEDIESNLSKKYGIITVDSEYEMHIIKKATRLNKDPNVDLTHRVFLRATSELTHGYIKK